MPPSPYAFHSSTQVTPLLASYVHSRVLDQVQRYADEWVRLSATMPQQVGEDPDRYVLRVKRAWEAERDAHVQGLRTAGWTDALLEVAQRYV